MKKYLIINKKKSKKRNSWSYIEDLNEKRQPFTERPKEKKQKYCKNIKILNNTSTLYSI